MASTFPKMGEEPLTSNIVNVSGNRSPYTQTVAKRGPAGDSESEPASVRGHISMDGEHNGPTFRPVATLPFQPDPSTGRGMRTVPSSLGNRDFWDRRADESGQVI